MMNWKLSPRITQYLFFTLFVVSVISGFRVLKRSERIVAQASTMIEENMDAQSMLEDLSRLEQEAQAALMVPYVSMAVSLFGVVVSTVMKVRQDRRNAQEASLTLQKKELEIEKLRMELDALKKEK